MPDPNGSLPTAPATNTFNGGDDSFLQIWAPPSLPDEQETGEPTEEEPTELETFAQPPAEPPAEPTEAPAETPAETPAAPIEAPAPAGPTWQPGGFARYRSQLVRITEVDDPSFFGHYVEFGSDGRFRTCRTIPGGERLYTLSPVTSEVTLAQIQIALLYEKFDAVDKEAQRLANEIDTAETTLRDYQNAKKQLHRLLGIPA